MIRRFFCVLIALFLALLCAARAEGVYDLVRLQVVAEDDSPAAQALKLELRDACLRYARVCLDGAQTTDEAYALLDAHAADFQAACRRAAREAGYAGNVCAEVGSFDFPDRLYGRLLVPAGEYRALRVTIGAGTGHNWWCVLYPTLCSVDESALDAQSVLDWLKRQLGGDA